ncbi:MAG: glycosyltransferase family 2 protein [Acidimicrobiales bacterium]
MADTPDSSPRDATPSVVAVVVAHDPGDWFEETLESLATQDYGRLSVLVVDAGSTGTLDSRVHAALPGASVVDAGDTVGFSQAANAILDTDIDPAFLLLCHDDVALAPDAVRQLVVESLRSNAGVAGPKLVDWYRTDRLQHVGYSVDRFAVAADIVDPGELDQEQHDAVADVFALPSACMLVRTGLFRSLGGFDPGIPYRGEDIDLCWRAHLLGARVLVVPDARVRHREDLYGRTGVDDIRRTRARNQLRTVLVTGSRLSLLLTLPMLALLSLGEAGLALLTGRISHVRDVLSSWLWNIRRLGEVRSRRRALRPLIRARHGDVRAMQEGGSVRINAFVRGQIGRRTNDQQIRTVMRTGTARIAALSAAIVVLFVLFGSRTLISDGVPAVGDFLGFGGSSGDLVGEWWSGWRHRDLGSPGTPRSGVVPIAVLTWLSGGAAGLVRLAWILGPVLAGLLGAWRMLVVTGSRRAQTGALLAYAVVPLPWVAIESASIAGLYGYAVAPWVLAALLHGEATSPFRSVAGPWKSAVGTAAGLGVSLGVATLFDPAVVVVVVPSLAGILLAALLTGRMNGLVRLFAVTVMGAVVAAAMALPQVLDQLSTGVSWAPFADGRSGGATDLALGDIVAFAVGTADASPLTYLLAVPLALAVLVGRSWRFTLAARGWMVALASWALVWAASWGVLPFGLPDPALLLAPAAAGVALATGAAVAVAEHDMRRAGFGWRQALLPMAILGAFLASIPTLALAESGRWDLPRGDFSDALPFADPADSGSYRVLWIAAPENIPGGGRSLTDTLAWSTSFDGLPIVADAGPAADEGAAALVPALLGSAFDGETMRLGRTLGGLGIRYIVVLDRLAPAPFSTTGREVDPLVAESFARQLDLRRVEGINTAMALYVNTEWSSVRAAASVGFDDGRENVADLAAAPLVGTVGVLSGRDTEVSGLVPEGTEIYLAQSPDTGWKLQVEGDRTGRRRSLGWATAFLPDRGGEALLSYDTPVWRQAALLFQAFAFVLAFVVVARLRLGGRRSVR